MQFLAGNHLGSTETVFNATETVNASIRYNPFGGRVPQRVPLAF